MESDRCFFLFLININHDDDVTSERIGIYVNDIDRSCTRSKAANYDCISKYGYSCQSIRMISWWPRMYSRAKN